MHVEISGVNFVNKGAELMMLAVLQMVREKIPSAKFVLAPGKDRPYERRAQLGFYHKIWFSKWGIPVGMYLGKYVPKTLREYYGLVSHQEIRIVLDASGFSYSDQWGPETSVMMAKAFKEWRKRGAKIIMLPQAMGPFTSDKIRHAFARMVSYADLVFPRDRISYGHVTDLLGKQEHVIQAPDFTDLVRGVVPQMFRGKEGRFCIIPNYRMIDKSSTEKGRQYIPFLVNCVQYLMSKNIRPFILIHEGENDLWLGKEINRCCNEDLQIVRETDPLRIKGIIGTCKGVISSRFHGLISALSQEVPALATGWSHKYEMLFAEFGFPEGYLSPDASDSEIKDRIDLISEETSAAHLRQRIARVAETNQHRSQEMWARVFECIGI